MAKFKTKIAASAIALATLVATFAPSVANAATITPDPTTKVVMLY